MGAFRGGRGAACERGRTRLQERTEDWFSERLGGGVHTLGGARFYGLCGGRGKQTAVALPRTTPPAPFGLGTSHTLVSYRARGYRWERFGMGGGSDAGRRKVEAGVDARGAQKAARRQVGTRGEPTFGEASFLIAALQISMALSCTSGCRVVLFTTALGSIPVRVVLQQPCALPEKNRLFGVSLGLKHRAAW